MIDPVSSELFPAQLLDVSSDDPLRYSWVELGIDPVSGDYADVWSPRRGEDARELNDRQLTVGDPGPLVWMRRRGGSAGDDVYEFYAGVDASAAYGDLAGLQSTDCLTATGPSGSVVLTYSGGVWISEDALTYPGDTGIVRFWFAAGSLHCSLETTNCGARELLDLGNGCFRGGQLTGHIVGDGTPCAGETFTVCVACSECPPAPTVTTDCCPDDPIPEELYYTVTGGGDCDGTRPLHYTPVNTWVGGDGHGTPGIGTCGGAEAVTVLMCTDGVWTFSTAGVATTTLSSSSCDPFELVFTGESNDTCGCTGPMTFTIFATTPTGGGGTGGGTGSACIGGACDDPDIAPFLYATVTDKVGDFTSIPSSLTFSCFTVGSEHFWLGTSNVTIGAVTGKPTIGANGSSLAIGFAGAVIGLAGDTSIDADGGYVCTPLAAVFHLDDGAGNSATVTVIA